MASTNPLLNFVPPTLLSTIRALKSLPQLESALEEYSTSIENVSTDLEKETAFEILEKKARPILSDGGCGKKGAQEILDKWKAGPDADEVKTPKESKKETVVSKVKKDKIVVEASDIRPGETKAAARRRLKEEAAAAVASKDVEPVQSEPLQSLPPALAAQLPPIFATSQESRFHADAIVTETKEIDLEDVTISVAEKELISSAHLRIKEGVHYSLFGRNGTGKSTLLRALADRIIPGLPSNIKIQLVSQVGNDLLADQYDKESEGSGQPISVLDAVKESDRVRSRAEREFNTLSKALDSQDASQIRTATTNVLIEVAQDELNTARRISLRRSGARGADARHALLAAEKKFEQAKADVLSRSSDQSRDWSAEATSLMASAQAVLESLDDSSTDSRARTILLGLGFSEAKITSPYSSLSGGWKSRAALASALLQSTHVLLLDEADNYLDLPAVIWLQGYIQSLPHTVITISHDREFSDNVSDELIVLRNNTLAYFDGNLTEYERQQRKKYKHAVKQQEALDRKREKVEKSIEDNLRQAKKSGDDNKLRMVKSRQTKLDERWGLETSAKGTRFKLNRDTQGYFLTSRQGIEIDAPDRPMNFAFQDPEPLRFPGALVHLDDVSFTFKEASKPTLRNVNFTLGEGERAAYVGPNGHGKTTLINLMMGNLQASSGTIEHHPKSKIRLYAQHTIEMLSSPPAGWTASSTDPLGLHGDPTTALGHFLEFTRQSGNGPPATEADARNVLGRLGLGGRIADQQKYWTLSGGQKVRIGLAKVFWGSPDLVILDEVTTHLDGDSITALITALRRYSGAVLLISHDRHAVKALVEGKGKAGAANGAVDSCSESSSEEDEVDEDPLSSQARRNKPAKTGKVYLVQNSKVKVLEGGMDEYSNRVAREAAKSNTSTV